ncbi:hypothetical protein NESM_000713600 [Novymonas esmeraldas]|uniref:Uncharacterized protein n=1 Tax=Novymonas esmeraldas TaxID=1808958 RepID=A0AAW0EVM6_9TRYP
MDYGTLATCTGVLYAPHVVLGSLALLWQPMLLIVGLLAAFVALLPLVATGIVYQALRWGGAADVTVAACVVVAQYVFSNVARVGVLHVCVHLQRLGWRHGWLLVRSRYPLVPLSIAVGAGFAAASLLVSGGALLAEAWGLSSVAVVDQRGGDGSPLRLHGTCAQLPRLVQLSFQQTFFSCGQVAWTAMLGQAYAALCPRHTAESTQADADGAVPRDAAHTSPTTGGMAAEGPVMRDVAKLLQAEPLVHAPTAPATGQPMSREEAEAGGGVRTSSGEADSGVDLAAVGKQLSVPTPLLSSTAAALASVHVADSVLSQRRAAAVLTGAAALLLHLLFTLPPVTAVSASHAATATTGGGSAACLVHVPLQCAVTLVSVVWGLWVVQCERHPSTYVRLAASASE